MPASRINFHTEDLKFKVPAGPQIKKWLIKVATEEGYTIKEINYIFCSDPYLLNINKEYLNHDYLTDIITFDNSEFEGEVEADIFISIDRVNDNANSFNQPFEIEFRRVMVHGLLHLLGYKDKSDIEQTEMRKMEDYYISQF